MLHMNDILVGLGLYIQQQYSISSIPEKLEPILDPIFFNKIALHIYSPCFQKH